MKLLDYFSKSDSHKELFRLVWSEELEASVREFSLMSGLPYATTHEELQKMEASGLVQSRTKGRAKVYQSNLVGRDRDFFEQQFDNKRPKDLLDALQELDLPMMGDLSSLQGTQVSDLEESLVLAVSKARSNPTLARSLPVVMAKALPNVDVARLRYWAAKYDLKKEVGFFVQLTGELVGNKEFRKMAKGFWDKRWSKDDYFFDSEKNVTGSLAKLVDMNTPLEARRWKLKMNMGFESFQSLLNKNLPKTD